MTARTELEEGAFRIADGLSGAPRRPRDNPPAACKSARERASAFEWVNDGGDYQCPSCWVSEERKSLLQSAASTLPTEAHFECPACGFRFVEQS